VLTPGSGGQRHHAISHNRRSIVSYLEDTFAWQLRAAKIPTPVREYVFAPPRRWRFDFAFPDRMIAVEIEGGVWSGGRHTTGAGFTRDCEKYNLAAELGWIVFRFTGTDVEDGTALTQIERVMSQDREAS